MFDLSPGYPLLTLLLFVKSGFYFQYLLVSAYGTGLALRWGLKDADPRLVWSAGLALGPVALAWLLWVMLRVSPGHAPGIYLVGCLLPFLGIIGVEIWRRGNPFAQWRERLRSVLTPLGGPALWLRPLWLFLAGLSAFVFVLCGVTAFLVPLHGNDSLEYAQAARLIANARSSAIYPFVDPFTTNGFYAPWTHPPGYSILLTLGYFIQGNTINAGIIRMCAPFCALFGLIALGLMGEFLKKGAGVIACLLWLLSPLYLHLIIQNHIDPVRIGAFVASVALSLHAMQHPHVRSVIALGIGAGLAHFTHSMGLLTLVLILPVFGVMARTTLLNRIGLGALACGVALSVTGINLLDNLRLYGSPVSDTPLIWNLPEIPIREYLEYSRGINGVYEKMLYGVFKGFSKFIDFGPLYWMALLMLVFLGGHILWSEDKTALKDHGVKMGSRFTSQMLAHLRISLFATPLSPSPVVFLAGIVAIFYLFLFSTLAIGSDLAIKNSRYLLTIQPLIALLAGVGFAFIATLYAQKAHDLFKELFGFLREKSHIRKIFTPWEKIPRSSPAAHEEKPS
jgi:hypothetical protein